MEVNEHRKIEPKLSRTDMIQNEMKETRSTTKTTGQENVENVNLMHPNRKILKIKLERNKTNHLYEVLRVVVFVCLLENRLQ